MTIQFIDLAAQQARIKNEIDIAIKTVLSHGCYVFGPEIQEFEQRLAEFSQARHAVSCANGTDALVLAMMTAGIGRGDAIFCPSFSFCATAESIALVGATPVFVDIDRSTYNMCSESLKQAIQDMKSQSDLTPKAIIAVDLFGQSADYVKISPIAKEEGLILIADSAQGFGTTLNGFHPSHWADFVTVSFFPAKPLGCYGDGGAVLTNNDEYANLLKSYRMHGAGEDRYDNVRIGLNSRLDTLQAAILLPKLTIFEDEIEKRNVVARQYINGLNDHTIRVPQVLSGVRSTWAQFTIEVVNPLKFAEAMKAKKIPTARYYPKAIHVQSAYKAYPVSSLGLIKTNDACKYVVSLPMHPYLDSDIQDAIINAVLTSV